MKVRSGRGSVQGLLLMLPLRDADRDLFEDKKDA